MISSGAGGHRIAPSAEGGTVLVSLYSWTIVTLMVTVARFVIGLIHKVKIGWDDALILLGSIIYTTSAVPWHMAVTRGGLGEQFEEISAERGQNYFKFAWAAQLLQLAAISCGKCSSAFLACRVAPQSVHERLIL